MERCHSQGILIVQGCFILVGQDVSQLIDGCRDGVICLVVA